MHAYSVPQNELPQLIESVFCSLTQLHRLQTQPPDSRPEALKKPNKEAMNSGALAKCKFSLTTLVSLLGSYVHLIRSTLLLFQTEPAQPQAHSMVGL